MIAPTLCMFLVVIGVGLLGVNVVQSRLFLADSPRGHQGLVVILYFLGAVIGGAALLLATAACASAGGLGPAGPRWSQAVGIVLGAVTALVLWGGRRTPLVAPAGIVAGTIGPAVLGVVLLGGASAPAFANGHARAIGAVLWPLAIVGYGLSLGFAGTLAFHSARRRQEAWAAIEARDREATRKNALPLIDLLREEVPKMHPDSPLWLFVARLPDTRDDAARQFLIARSLQVPNFETDLSGTATTGHPRYRHGCLDLIRFAPAPRPEWRPIVEGAIAVTVREMAERPTWLADVDYLSNPDPVEHVRAHVEAARRVAPDGALNAAIDSLRAAVSQLPESDARAAALQSLGA